MARYWTEETPSAKVKAVVRLPSGKRVGRTFDYWYEADEWAAETDRRAQAAAQSARGDVVLTLDDVTARSSTAKATPTVTKYGRAWLDRVSGLMAAATADGYRTHLNALDRTGIGRTPIDEVRKADVEAWVTRQVRAKEVTALTINARRKVLGMVLRAAVDAEVPGVVDATRGVRKLPEATKVERFLEPVEDDALIAAASASDDPRVLGMVLLGLDAGLRWQEAAALTGAAVANGTIVVRQVVERSSDKVRQGTKGGRVRRVPIVTERLDRELRRLTMTRGAGLLFPNSVGTAPDYHRWRRGAFVPVVEASGLAPFTFHDLRHTYGTRLALAGMPRAEIADVMGHADERTTGRYIHAGESAARTTRVREALSAFVA